MAPKDDQSTSFGDAIGQVFRRMDEVAGVMHLLFFMIDFTLSSNHRRSKSYSDDNSGCSNGMKRHRRGGRSNR